ncbi:hypothetical protein JCM9279_003535 [Rhodotorula babjevae]
MPSLLAQLARLSCAAASTTASLLPSAQPLFVPQTRLSQQTPPSTRSLSPIEPPAPIAPPSRLASILTPRPTSRASSTPFWRLQPRANKPVGRPDIKLRPYQVDCVRAVLDELKRGDSSRLGVSAPTGSGKTAMFTALISHLPALVHPVTREVATQVLVVVSSVQLAEQTAKAIQRAYAHMSVEVDQGDTWASGFADVTVCTYQTLARSSCKRLDKFVPDRFKAVIVDEAHHAAAKSYLDILARFDSHVEHALATKAFALSVPHAAASVIEPAPEANGGMSSAERSAGQLDEEQASRAVPPAAAGSSVAPSSIPPDEPQLPVLAPVAAKLDWHGRMRVPVLAFSATWARSDRLALGKVIDKIVWHCDWLDLIRGKWLSEISFTTVHLDGAVDLTQVAVSKKTGDFQAASLSRALNSDTTNELILKAYLENAAARRSTLVFAASVAHVLSLASTFCSRGIDARVVHADTPSSQREALYRAFRAGEFPVLVNCGILTEGADFPAIDCVVVARPTRSQTLFLQMIGRGLRLSPDTGKLDCLVIDLVSNATNLGIVCTPTLLGLDPAVVHARQQHAPEPARRNKVDLSTVSYQHLSLEDLAKDLKAQGQETDDVIPLVSSFAWLDCGGGRWVLALHGRGRLEIVRDKGEFRVTLHERHACGANLGKAASTAPADPDLDLDQTTTLIAMPSSFRHALVAAETAVHVHPRLSDLVPSLERDAPWRRRPASDSLRSLALQSLASSTQHTNRDSSSDTATTSSISTHVFDGDGDEPWWAYVAFAEQLTEGDASDLVAATPHGGLAVLERQRRALVERGRERARGAGGEQQWEGRSP